MYQFLTRFLTSRNLFSTRLTAWTSCALLTVLIAALPSFVHSQIQPLSQPLMIGPSHGHSATLLPNGKVLIAGGENTNGTISSTDIFDPANDTFSAGPALSTSRKYHSATLLTDDHVLIAGGQNQGVPLTSTEVFDPTNNALSAGPLLQTPRSGHSATKLADGRVVVIGGDTTGSVEIFNPTTQQFTTVPANLTTPRSFHSAAVLQDGKILIVGGAGLDNKPLDSGEIFDPATQTFSAVSNALHTVRMFSTLEVLPDGKVQIIGGSRDYSMEVFDPSINAFGAYSNWLLNDLTTTDDVLRARTRAALLHNTQDGTLVGALAGLLDREEHTVTEMQNNKTLIAGGLDSQDNPLNTAAVVSSSPATVSTSKTDYSPGEYVTITGAGWQSGENVSLLLHEEPTHHEDAPLWSVADSQGKFTNEDYLMEEHDAGVTYTITAKGQGSGFTAQTAFTDAPADVTITPASGGGAIPANTAGGTYTTLTDPILTENSAGAIGTGTIILTVPSGFQFDTGGTAPTVKVTGGATAGHNINNTADGGTISATVAASTITITITAKSNSGDANTLTWQNVRVRPTAASPLASGNLTKTGTSSYTLASGSPTTYGTLTEVKADQTITFGALGNKTYGDADFGVSATASSSLTVTFSSQTTGTCTVSGSTVHIVAAGTCTIRASQAGNSSYNAAPNVDQSFTISKATPTITWSNPADITYGTALSATQLNATASVGGIFVYTPASNTVLNAGNNQNLKVDFTPTDTANYTTATKTVQINVGKATPTVNWNNPTDITYGTALSGTQLNAAFTAVVNGSTVSVAGTPTYTPASGAVLNAADGQTLHVAFTPTDTTNYNNASKDVTINVKAKAVTASIIGDPTKPYDGNANATLTPANFSLSGLVGTESFTVTKTTGTYNSPNVSATTVSTTLVAGDFTAGAGTLASNYTLPTTTGGAGHISKVTITASIIGDPTKPYNGNTNATLTSANFSLTGLVGTESFTVTKTTGTYNSKDVATANTVTASLAGTDFTPAVGTLATNYTLPTAASGPGHITAVTLTAAIIGDPTKPYDGNTTATLISANFSLTTLVSGESFTVTKTAGTYNFKDVTTATTVTASLAAGDFTAGVGTLATNYTLPISASGAGHITAVTLTAAIIGDPTKPYNGNTTATLAAANFSLSPLVSGESFTVTKTAGTYNFKDVTTATT
ncbi:MAG: hypothetical protein HY267_01820, partial [Deltaproteobacteria bacterium]|nr:hypothetical protein [Deltaproteobacteria bacterium]